MLLCSIILLFSAYFFHVHYRISSIFFFFFFCICNYFISHFSPLLTVRFFLVYSIFDNPFKEITTGEYNIIVSVCFFLLFFFHCFLSTFLFSMQNSYSLKPLYTSINIILNLFNLDLRFFFGFFFFTCHKNFPISFYVNSYAAKNHFTL